MNKILAEIYVPALEVSFDVFLPLTISVYEATNLVADAVARLSKGKFYKNPTTLLYGREDGMMLNINKSIGELNLKNGSGLMLI